MQIFSDDKHRVYSWYTGHTEWNSVKAPVLYPFEDLYDLAFGKVLGISIKASWHLIAWYWSKALTYQAPDGKRC